MQFLLNDGDEVIIPSPYWVSFPSMTELAGGIPVIINTEAETNFKITPEQLKKSITSKTRAVVINSPSNPTGAAYSFDELKALSEVILEAGILAISDDIYESIIYGSYKFCNIANVSDDMCKNTMVLNGVSKAYSMTGWRIGYMAGNEEIIKKVDTIQGQSTSNPTSISQYAAIEALSGDQSVVAEMVKAFDRRRQFVVEGLNNIPGFSCYNPEGAFYVFPRVDEVYKFNGWKKVEEKYKDEYKSSSLSAYLLEEAKSAVVPGIGFGNDNYFRMSFATSDESLKEGISRIREAIEKLI
jgi:aspartate aminotransferase